MLVKRLLQQPDLLETLATAALADWLASLNANISRILSDLYHTDRLKTEELLSTHIQTIRNYLDSNVPTVLFNELARQILQTNKLGYNNVISLRMAEIVFSKKLTHLKICYGWFEFGNLCPNPYSSNPLMLTNLTHLYLENVSNDDYEVIAFLEALHNLELLSLSSTFCNHTVIACVAQNCPSIQELHLCDDEVDDDIMELLTKLSNLRILKLDNTSETSRGIQALLTYCKNIEYIEYVDVPRALELMASSEHPGAVLQLRTCEVTNPSSSQARLLTRMCPNMQHLIINYKFRHADLASFVTGFKYLTELTFQSNDYYEDRIEGALEQVGCHLLRLKFTEVKNIDFNALMHISRVCPDLESLKISQMFVVPNSKRPMHTEKNKCGTLESLPFRQLKEFHIDTYSFANTTSLRDVHTSSVRDALKFVLSNCLRVETIYLWTNFRVPCDFMMCVLSENPMTFLRKMVLHYCFEMDHSLLIHRLAQNCISPPEVILHVES